MIDVKCGVSKWTVHRTFVDFSVLHRILSQTYPTIAFPILPSRSDEKNKNFANMRKKLQIYLRELIDCSFEEKISVIEKGRSIDSNSNDSYILQADIRAFLFDGQVNFFLCESVCYLSMTIFVGENILSS